jgi:hypothetical protein
MNAPHDLGGSPSEDLKLVEAGRLADEAIFEISELSLVMARLLRGDCSDHYFALRGMAVRCSELAFMLHAAGGSTGPELEEMRVLLYGRLHASGLDQKGGAA